jgi:hypothetical protein
MLTDNKRYKSPLAGGRVLPDAIPNTRHLEPVPVQKAWKETDFFHMDDDLSDHNEPVSQGGMQEKRIPRQLEATGRASPEAEPVPSSSKSPQTQVSNTPSPKTAMSSNHGAPDFNITGMDDRKISSMAHHQRSPLHAPSTPSSALVVESFKLEHESLSHSSAPTQEPDSYFSRRASANFREHKEHTQHTSSGGNDDKKENALSPRSAKPARFESLPEPRRKSIEVRPRNSLDCVREVGAGAAAADAAVASTVIEAAIDSRRTSLTSEQKTQLVALDVLEDVARSSISADTGRHLEYLLESLEPLSEMPLSSRAMELVEALGAILRRKLRVLCDIEFVRALSSCFSHANVSLLRVFIYRTKRSIFFLCKSMHFDPRASLFLWARTHACIF